jgi:hypothetical protein
MNIHLQAMIERASISEIEKAMKVAFLFSPSFYKALEKEKQKKMQNNG